MDKNTKHTPIVCKVHGKTDAYRNWCAGCRASLPLWPQDDAAPKGQEEHHLLAADGGSINALPAGD